MKRKKTMLRMNAMMARQRLASGFWNQNHNAQSIGNINDPNSEDEKLYRTVADILRSGKQNPLGEVIDIEYMDTLDDASRQRYVLTMSRRVNQSIERYNRCG